MKDIQAQLTSIFGWIEKQLERDKAKHDLIIQFQTANNDQMDQMHKSLDMFNQGQTLHIHASNSTDSLLVMTPCSFDGTSPVLE